MSTRQIKSMVLTFLLIILFSFVAKAEEVRTGTIIILGERHNIRFVTINNEAYISWNDLLTTLPLVFTVTSKGEILVNPVIFKSLLLDDGMTTDSEVIQSTIDGTFEGWDGDTLFPLTNGQIWQQAEYNYHYHYAYRPKVTIHKISSGWKMKVEGVDKEIKVKRIK